MTPVKSEQEWDDEQIDVNVKTFIKDRRNGQYLPIDIVSHLEYFYNTLLLNHDTENPFHNPSNYPALLYFDNMSPDTILEKHR